MKLLFLLVFAPLCLAYCPAGHYKDFDRHKCIKCTPCHTIQTPCSAYKDAVCAPINDSENHHFQKNRIHFLDYAEDLHDKNFVEGLYDHHKKATKHSKKKHTDKHHHKKKHYEFDDDDYDDDNFDYGDEFDSFETTEKPKKHKKHYTLSNKGHKEDKIPIPTPTEMDDKSKYHLYLGKEEALKEWLIQSEKKLKIQKDNLLKTLKGENGDGSVKSKKKVRLNSPVLDDDNDDYYDQTYELKSKKHSDSAALKALADLNESDEDTDLQSFLTMKEDESALPMKSGHSSSEVVGEGKTPEEELKKEMGKNFIYEKPRFNVIPFVVGKDFNAEKKGYIPKHHSPPEKKHTEWDDDYSENKESIDEKDLHEMKSNEVVSLPFTAAETLVWDWQAVAVASAVASCLVFFLVVSIYFIVNARQWKKVNKSYNKEFEEMSTTMALMHSTMESGSPDSHTTSLYMENIVSPVKEEVKKCDHHKA